MYILHRYPSKEIVFKETMPSKSKAAAIKRCTLPRQPKSTSTKTRVMKKPFTKLRSLSGWNVFQREANQGCNRPHADWACYQKEVSKMWKALSHDDRVAYEAHASYEQNQREKLQTKPLPTKNSMENDDVKALGKRWARKINRKRLETNEHLYRSHIFFDGGLGLLDSYSALREEHLQFSGARNWSRAWITTQLEAKFYSSAPMLDAEAAGVANVRECSCQAWDGLIFL